MTWPAPNFWRRSSGQAEHRGQELLRRDRAVPRLRRGDAGVAVAAGLRRLTEVVQQPHPAALDGLAQRQHRLQVRAEFAALRASPFGRVDHLALLHNVLQAVGQPRGRRQAVAAGAAGLLVVALDRLGQVEVRDEAHVRLVDAHAEGDGGDHDQAVLAQEPRLVGRAHAARPGRRGRAARDAVLHQELRGLVHRRLATGSRRCPRRPGARCAAGRAAASSARSSATIRYWMFGRSKLRHEVLGLRPGSAAARSPRRVACVAVAVSAMRGTYGQRSCSVDRFR